MTDVFDIRQTRLFSAGFSTNDPIGMTCSWLTNQKFKASADKNGLIKGEQKGIHINFQPEISILFQQYQAGAVSVSVHYYAKVKVASGIAMGILTGGLSTLVGVGTFASHAVDADNFIKTMWMMMNNMAKISAEVINEGTNVQLYLQQKQQQVSSPMIQPVVVQQPTYVDTYSVPQQNSGFQPNVVYTTNYQTANPQPIIQSTTQPSFVQVPVEKTQLQVVEQKNPTLDFTGYTSRLSQIPSSELNNVMMQAKDLCWAIERELGIRRANGSS